MTGDTHSDAENVFDMEQYRHAVAAISKAKEDAAEVGILKSGDGGGTSGGMEARVAKLEGNVEHLVKQVDKLADMPERVRALEVKVDHLPSKEYISARLVALLAAFAAIVIFADKIKGIVGLH
ncbi:hypothetical protein [Novosphingobium sp.]|uniref:hypothetical protein n=1 Tax=Novosphingobium sp. TaxID=1874826 RepID=UPI003D0E419F